MPVKPLAQPAATAQDEKRCIRGQGRGYFSAEHLMRHATNFLRDTSGATIVEYGLALLVVAGITIAAFGALASTTNGHTSAACTAVETAC